MRFLKFKICLWGTMQEGEIKEIVLALDKISEAIALAARSIVESNAAVKAAIRELSDTIWNAKD